MAKTKEESWIIFLIKKIFEHPFIFLAILTLVGFFLFYKVELINGNLTISRSEFEHIYDKHKKKQALTPKESEVIENYKNKKLTIKE